MRYFSDSCDFIRFPHEFSVSNQRGASSEESLTLGHQLGADQACYSFYFSIRNSGQVQAVVCHIGPKDSGDVLGEAAVLACKGPEPGLQAEKAFFSGGKGEVAVYVVEHGGAVLGKAAVDVEEVGGAVAHDLRIRFDLLHHDPYLPDLIQAPLCETGPELVRLAEKADIERDLNRGEVFNLWGLNSPPLAA